VLYGRSHRWLRDICIEPAKRFDAPLVRAEVFNARPAACAWVTSKSGWHEEIWSLVRCYGR
jgi:hypothetical protein